MIPTRKAALAVALAVMLGVAVQQGWPIVAAALGLSLGLILADPQPWESKP